jgi:hypothetical protein
MKYARSRGHWGDWRTTEAIMEGRRYRWSAATRKKAVASRPQSLARQRAPESPRRDFANNIILSARPASAR